MRVPLRWLEEFIDLSEMAPAQLADVLASIGHEVEGIEVLEPGWTDVVVGRVTGISDHPDADKIRVCQVETGQGPEQIICGAWNFDEGAYVAVARPGAVLPGEFAIGKRTIRGVESNGMICSEKELGLGEDHAGILVLEGAPEIGSPFEALLELPDVVFDLSITPNRGDAMSILGIARDLAAYFDTSYSIPVMETATTPGSTEIAVAIEDQHGCRRFTGREIRGVSIGRSPLWVRHRLRKAGVRSISNIVDVTNYVMLELGHPLHAFDARSIVGGSLVVRRAREGEKLVTLDGTERDLSTDDLVICDDAGPTSMAGTMGGERSEVSETTVDVLMEAASWDPPTIMYMSRRHDLRSEASMRFERGVDPALSDIANSRASAMVVSLAGGDVIDGFVDEIGTPFEPSSLRLRVSDVTRLLGPGFDSAQIAAILRRLGMEVSGDDPLQVEVPSYRVDITRPVDLVEEVARIHGYERFGSTVPTGVAGRLTVDQRKERHLYSILVGVGLHQAVTLPFVGEPDLQALGMGDLIEELVRVRNPLSDEEGRLRPSMLPNLLRALRFNASHGHESVALFESGLVFRAVPGAWDSRLPEQRRRLAWAVTGPFGQSSLGASARFADADLSLAIVRHVAKSLLLPEVGLVASRSPGYHPGRTARVVVDGADVGFAGELSPDAARHFDLDTRVAVAELDLDPLVVARGFVESRGPSVFPFVDFDLSFVIPDSMPVGELIEATAAPAGELLETRAVFDEFRGEAIPDGSRAVAIRYRLRAPDRTLSNEEVQPLREAMIAAAADLGARLRGV